MEFHELPDLKALGSAAPLVMDFSSNVLSRRIDWSRVGLAFGGAQKNIGPAGVTLVVVREDLLGHALKACPSAFNYQTVADNGSMYNTPPTYSIYMAGLTFQWLKRQGGVEAMEQRNIAKAALLYEFLDGSSFYRNPVDRSAPCQLQLHGDRILHTGVGRDFFAARNQLISSRATSFLASSAVNPPIIHRTICGE